MSRVFALAGPTGIGKTEASLEIARRIPAEMVVVDSMQVYRGMDVGTGKPSRQARAEIPHHGLDLVEPEEEFDALRYVREVRPVIQEVLARGRWVVLVAGCGLYLRALLRGLCPAPGRIPGLREALWKEAQEQGAHALHRRLEEADPKAAKRLHPNDLRRVIRALEVCIGTGRPLSDWQAETSPAVPGLGPCPVIALTCERNRLYQRIESRVDEWLASGWLEEARALSERRMGLTAREALGYRHLYDHLEGKLDWGAARARIQRDSRRYAKRQWAWFRHEAQVRWLSVDDLPPAQVAEAVLKQVA